VLDEALDCASKIHQLKPEEKTEGQLWDGVEKIFKENIFTICQTAEDKAAV
jgi:hypothetical protein